MRTQRPRRHSLRRPRAAGPVLALLACGSGIAEAQRSLPSAPPARTHIRDLDPPVNSAVRQAIGNGTGGFAGTLAQGDRFGMSVAPLGDFDGDGVPDLVVAAPGDDDGGALYLLFLRFDGTVRDQRKISPSTCGCSGPFFSVDRIGDLDGDGVTDLIVGSGGSLRVLFLGADGSVRALRTIGEGTGGFVGQPPVGFGMTVTRLGDVDGDGILDVAAGSYYGVVILFLNVDGTVKSQQDFSPGIGGFPLVPPTFESSFGLHAFGLVVDGIGDFDGDGVRDLLVTGRESIFEGGLGHVWLVFLHADGTVKSTVSLSSYSIGIWPFQNECAVWYDDQDYGTGAACVGDLDGDGVVDLVVGSPNDWIGCCESRPVIWVLNLNGDGTVKRTTEITAGSEPYDLPLEALDFFGHAIASPGDLDGDGRRDLAVGAWGTLGAPSMYCEYFETEPVGLTWILFGQ